MSEAPERIWAQDAEPAECHYIGGGWWDDECGSTQYPHMVEYIRADLSDAAIAGAYEAAAGALDLGAHIMSRHGSDAQEATYQNAAKLVRDLPPADALAARDAHTARAVEALEAQLAEAVEALEGYVEAFDDLNHPKNEVGANEYYGALLVAHETAHAALAKIKGAEG